jgi:hypothetical protein
MPASPLTLQESVTVVGLGEVQVRSLRLSELLPLIAKGEGHETRMLALAVTHLDGERWSAEQWDVWAGQHLGAWSDLQKHVSRVCGLDAVANEGNS